MTPYPDQTHLMLATARHNELLAEADKHRMVLELRNRSARPRTTPLTRWRHLLRWVPLATAHRPDHHSDSSPTDAVNDGPMLTP
jgi:hypothetical protein